MLFDEPLSNLDARLRDEVRAEIHELHTRLGFTAVFVTHDQSEALALGDRLAVMRHGRIEQYDTPQQIFEQPATEYVAAFLGMSNRLVCRYVDGRWVADGQVLDGAPVQTAPPRTALAVRLRSDDVALHPPDNTPRLDRTTASVTVVDAEYAGRYMDVVVMLGGTRVQARIPTGDSGILAAPIGTRGPPGRVVPPRRRHGVSRRRRPDSGRRGPRRTHLDAGHGPRRTGGGLKMANATRSSTSAAASTPARRHGRSPRRRAS